MSKLYDLHRETVRQAKKDGQKITDDELPILWILTPTLAAPTLTGFGAINEVSWGNGVYLLPPLQKTGIIVIHQLPAIPATLWFRLLGKGKVQQQAISEVAALPVDSLLSGMMTKSVFAKPANRCKKFSGFVLHDEGDLYRVGNVSRREQIFCAEIVSWLSEYRIYVVKSIA
jgi:ATP-grasp domain, R2K clade family 2